MWFDVWIDILGCWEGGKMKPRVEMKTKEKITIWIACILATVFVLHPKLVVRFYGLLMWMLIVIHLWVRKG